MNHTDPIYGPSELSGVMEELIHTQIFQRLKRIHQGGAVFLVNPLMNHTRYDHSIGVMLLVRSLDGSKEDQIAALLHDISHTAFSHLIDYVLEIEGEDYHEKRYAEVLMDSEIKAVLTAHQFDVSQFLDLEQYHLLEYPLPNLSADRIDYTLRDLFLLGVITPDEISWFLDGLQVCQGRIVVKAIEYGQWFRAKYEYLVSEYFAGKENIAINLVMKKIVKECLDQGVLQESDFYQDDFYLLEKINAAFDLKQRINELNRGGLVGEKLRVKKRWVDPEVLVNGRVVRLSTMTDS